jgi:hypothetical protein
VPRLEIHAFADDHLDGAAGLLAARHRRHRADEPLLAAAYEEPAAARVAIEDLLGQDEADGVAATRGGRLVGYLIGIRNTDTWGPNVWVEPAGHAAEPAEEVRDLYAAAAAGAGFAWARACRHDAIVVDWRVTNLLASRFWTARGLRPTFLPLHRLIA